MILYSHDTVCISCQWLYVLRSCRYFFLLINPKCNDFAQFHCHQCSYVLMLMNCPSHCLSIWRQYYLNVQLIQHSTSKYQTSSHRHHPYYLLIHLRHRFFIHTHSNLTCMATLLPLHHQNNEPITPQTVRRAVQYWLDKSTIYPTQRWIAFTVLLILFFLRVYLVQGYFIIAYGLGIFLLNNFIAFLSPLEDPSLDGPTLPTKSEEEYKPFTRRLPEFKFWLACFRGTGTSIIMTFFSMFDIPVFWPILVMYFGVLFFMTMKRQIAHMYKHKYVPFSFGKSKYSNAGVEHGRYGGGMAGASRKGM